MEEHSTAQRGFAEMIGTGLLVYVGAGSVPAILLLENGTKAPFSGADIGMIAFAFGLSCLTRSLYHLDTIDGDSITRISMIAAPQKTRSLSKLGTTNLLSHAPATRSQAPTVTTWNTPTMSSTVVWSVLSSSCS